MQCCGIALDEKPDITLEQRFHAIMWITAIHNVSIAETVKPWDGLEAKQNMVVPVNRTLNLLTFQMQRKTEMMIKRIIDTEKTFIRDCDDPDTGNIVHECKEALSKHQGHGAAKFKVKANQVETTAHLTTLV
jgi:hypothetical protein